MRSVSITNCKKLFILGLTLSTCFFAVAQENSPYSRFGLGDIVPGQNIVNRAMGGATATYYDPVTVNFTNPASYARLKYTTFDVGIDYTSRNIKTADPIRNLRSGYIIPAYVQVGVPLSREKNWGMNFGLRPTSRINYSLSQREKQPGMDTALALYNGDGGGYQAYWGMGAGTKNFTIGFNAGYAFGSKNYVNERVFLSDSIAYEKGKWSDSTHFSGLFLQAGFQYNAKLSKKMMLKVGGYAHLKSTLNATRDIRRETFVETATQGEVQRDSVYINTEKGKIVVPGTYGLGLALEKEMAWAIHAEYSISQWSDYRYYGTPDLVKDSWVMRVGGSMIPNYRSPKYWNQVQYRAGFYFGNDYIVVNNNLPLYAFTFGASFPVRKYGNQLYTNQYTSINTAFEIGARGNKSNSLRESFYRISVGFSLSDIWFLKQKL